MKTLKPKDIDRCACRNESLIFFCPEKALNLQLVNGLKNASSSGAESNYPTSRFVIRDRLLRFRFQPFSTDFHPSAVFCSQETRSRLSPLMRFIREEEELVITRPITGAVIVFN
jgi:hypothetical protein